MDIIELKNFRKKLIIGLERSYEKMVEFKKSKNSPIIVSKDGKIVKLDPNKINPKTTYHS